MPFCRSSIGGGAPTIPGSVPDGISLATPRSESFQRLRGHQVSCRLFLGFICGIVVFVRTTGDFNFVDEMRVNTSEEKLAVPLPLFCELHPLAKRAFSILGGIAGYLKGAGLVRVCAWFTCVCVCVNFLSVQYLVWVCVLTIRKSCLIGQREIWKPTCMGVCQQFHVCSFMRMVHDQH